MKTNITGNKINELIENIIFNELKFYEFFIANITHHLLKKVPDEWDGNFNITGLMNILQDLYTTTFSEEDDDKRKELIEENNKLLSGLVNIFVDKVIEKLHNTYKITVSELPYNIKLYLLDLPNDKISKRLILSVTTIGSFDFNNCTTTKTDILSINIEE